MLCSALGGLSAMINHPLEVVMVEMQSLRRDPKRRSNAAVSSTSTAASVRSTAAEIYNSSGWRGFTRGAPVRALLNVYVTVSMVYGSQLLHESLHRWEHLR